MLSCLYTSHVVDFDVTIDTIVTLAKQNGI